MDNRKKSGWIAPAKAIVVIFTITIPVIMLFLFNGRTLLAWLTCSAAFGVAGAIAAFSDDKTEMNDSKNESRSNHVGFAEVAIAAIVLALGIWLISSSGDAPKEQEPPPPAPEIVQLKKKSLLCYEHDDWLAMIASIQDSNMQAMRVLMEGGKCFQTSRVEKVSYLDPFLTGSALIQMPSGKTAFALQADIQR